MKKLKLLLLVLLVGLMFVSCEKDDILKPPPTVVVPVPEYATIKLVFSDSLEAGDVFQVSDCQILNLTDNVVLGDFVDEVVSVYPEDFIWNMDTALVRGCKDKELAMYIRAGVIRSGSIIGGVNDFIIFTLIVEPDINIFEIDILSDD